MTKFEKAKAEFEKKYGIIIFNGKQYVYVSEAYADGTYADPHYSSYAICETDTDDDDLHSVRWEIKPDNNFDITGDESELCDWDNPIKIDDEWADWVE